MNTSFLTFIEAVKAPESKNYTNCQPIMQCAIFYLTMHRIIPKN